MNFRLANIDDIPKLCDLLTLLFTQEQEFTADTSVQQQGLQAIIEDNKKGHILVAEYEGKIVAMVNLLYTVSTALGGKVAILEDMVVAKNYRGRRVGSDLIKYAIDFAKHNGCLRITLLTDDDNYIAHNFYLQHNFQLSTMRVFRQDL